VTVERPVARGTRIGTPQQTVPAVQTWATAHIATPPISANSPAVA
jgi:hypothetical protein